MCTRFLKGIYNCRPPCPKYSCTWDVDIVLRYIENLPDNKDLSFQQLSHKLVMLMALANTDRCSDLAALDLSYHSSVGNGERFWIPGLMKSRRKGPPLESFYSSFPEAPRLCPEATLHCYVERSKHLRCGSQGKDPPLISVRKPHKPVKPATIGHWIKAMMKAAGINTDMFSAHSTRGASTSKANTLGVLSADILKAANWSSTSTFWRFYHRPTHSASFGRTVLQRQGTSPGELQMIPYCKTDYVVVVYPEPPKYNYRFLKDSRNLMRRMNCMRRWRIHRNNIVSFPPGPWTHRAIYRQFCCFLLQINLELQWNT